MAVHVCARCGTRYPPDTGVEGGPVRCPACGSEEYMPDPYGPGAEPVPAAAEEAVPEPEPEPESALLPDPVPDPVTGA